MTSRADSSTGQLVQFARTMASYDEIPVLLRRLCARVTEFTGSAGASASLVAYRQVYLTSAEPDSLRELPEAEQRESSGPAIEAAESGEPVLVPRLAAAAGRWPAFAGRAAEFGIRAVAVVPMVGASGALAVYYDAERDWSTDELELVLLMGALIAGRVAGATEVERQRQLSRQAQQQMAERSVVEQAKGIIAATRRVTVERAFAILRKYANDHNATLLEVADAIVNIGLRI
jgi:GAF domain-containing protein